MPHWLSPTAQHDDYQQSKHGLEKLAPCVSSILVTCKNHYDCQGKPSILEYFGSPSLPIAKIWGFSLILAFSRETRIEVHHTHHGYEDSSPVQHSKIWGDLHPWDLSGAMLPNTLGLVSTVAIRHTMTILPHWASSDQSDLLRGKWEGRRTGSREHKLSQIPNSHESWSVGLAFSQLWSPVTHTKPSFLLLHCTSESGILCCCQ